jgi:hypothetical protein
MPASLRIRRVIRDDSATIARLGRLLDEHQAAQAFYRSLGAIEEPVMAHALILDRFQIMAAEGIRSSDGGKR